MILALNPLPLSNGFSLQYTNCTLVYILCEASAALAQGDLKRRMSVKKFMSELDLKYTPANTYVKMRYNIYK